MVDKFDADAFEEGRREAYQNWLAERQEYERAKLAGDKPAAGRAQFNMALWERDLKRHEDWATNVVRQQQQHQARGGSVKMEDGSIETFTDEEIDVAKHSFSVEEARNPREALEIQLRSYAEGRRKRPGYNLGRREFEGR